MFLSNFYNVGISMTQMNNNKKKIQWTIRMCPMINIRESVEGERNMKIGISLIEITIHDVRLLLYYRNVNVHACVCTVYVYVIDAPCQRIYVNKIIYFDCNMKNLTTTTKHYMWKSPLYLFFCFFHWLLLRRLKRWVKEKEKEKKGTDHYLIHLKVSKQLVYRFKSLPESPIIPCEISINIGLTVSNDRFIREKKRKTRKSIYISIISSLKILSHSFFLLPRSLALSLSIFIHFQLGFGCIFWTKS